LKNLYDIELLQQREMLSADTVLWRKLGPYGEHWDGQFVLKRAGIQSWDALSAFIQHSVVALRHADLLACTFSGADFGFALPVWALDRLTPSPTWLNELQSWLKESYPAITILLVLEHLAQSVPNVYQISAQTCTEVVSAQPTQFWQAAEAKLLLDDFYASHAYGDLIATLAKQHNTTGSTVGLAQWLNQIALALPIHATQASPSLANAATQSPNLQEHAYQGRTAAWTRLQDLDQALRERALNHAWRTILPKAIDLYQHPLASLTRQLQRQPSQGGVYSIGAGQMLAILDYTRQLQDSGVLPLDTPLLADNHGLLAITELALTGQRRGILNDLWLNPQDRKPIAPFNARLRLDLIERHKPEIIYLNVKAQVINQVVNDELLHSLIQLMQADPSYRPKLVMPTKSLSETGTIPYQELYQRIKTASPILADHLCVLGGFFAAPSVLSGGNVQLAIAAIAPAAAERVAYYLGQEHSETPNDSAEVGLAQSIHNESLSIETLQGYQAAVSLMAGGANKNFLTYYAARSLLEQAFAADHRSPREWLTQLNQLIKQLRQRNLSLNQLMTQRLANLDEAMPTPQALEADFVHCLPLDAQGVCSIVTQSYSLQRHLLRAPIAQRQQLATTGLKRLISDVQTDRQRILGTRNARDGLIDALINYFYHSWQATPGRLPQSFSLAEFIDQFYPVNWRGCAAQEGRNGMIPMLARASLMTDYRGTLWPAVLERAFHWYYPTAAVPSQTFLHAAPNSVTSPQASPQHDQAIIHDTEPALQQWRHKTLALVEWCEHNPRNAAQVFSKWLYASQATMTDELKQPLPQLLISCCELFEERRAEKASAHEDAPAASNSKSSPAINASYGKIRLACQNLERQ